MAHAAALAVTAHMALSGKAVATVQIGQTSSLAALRQAIASAAGLGGPFRLLFKRRILAGSESVQDAGIYDGAIVDIVKCSHVVATASTDRTAKLWCASSGECLLTFQGHGDQVMSVCFSPDGEMVATSSTDRTARLWEVCSGRQLRKFEGHRGPVYSAVFSSDGRELATTSHDRTAKIWNILSGEITLTLEGHDGLVHSADFSPDGSCLATSSDDSTARLWDLDYYRSAADERSREDGFIVLEGHEDPVYSASFSPDGTRVITGCADYRSRLWNRAGELMMTLYGHGSWVRSACFSPDGKLILTASGDDTARIFCAETGECRLTMRGHDDWLRTASWSPDGNLVATCSKDRTVKLWSPVTGEEVLTLTGHINWVRDCAFSPDGRLPGVSLADHTDASVLLGMLQSDGVHPPAAKHADDDEKPSTLGTS